MFEIRSYLLPRNSEARKNKPLKALHPGFGTAKPAKHLHDSRVFVGEVRLT